MEDKQMMSPFLRYGGAKKSTFDMSPEELEQAAQNILRKVKEKAFSKGLPIHFAIDGVLMAEYPDGRIEVVKMG
jgi:hypothetical protein